MECKDFKVVLNNFREECDSSDKTVYLEVNFNLKNTIRNSTCMLFFADDDIMITGGMIKFTEDDGVYYVPISCIETCTLNYE